MKQHVEDGVNGWIVLIGNVEALLARVLHLKQGSTPEGVIQVQKE
jgi:hypothetical protein